MKQSLNDMAVDYYENFYHGFVAGALANMHEYIVKSNYKEVLNTKYIENLFL